MFANCSKKTIFPLYLIRNFSQSVPICYATQNASALSSVKTILKTHTTTNKPIKSETAEVTSTPKIEHIGVDIKKVVNAKEVDAFWNQFKTTELFLRYRIFFENWSNRELLLSCFTHESKATLGIPSNGNLQFLGLFALRSILSEIFQAKYSNVITSRNLKQVTAIYLTRAYLSTLFEKRWNLQSFLRYQSTENFDMNSFQFKSALAIVGAIFSEKGPTVCKQFVRDCLLQKQDDPLHVCYGLLSEQNDAEDFLNDLQFAETFSKTKKLQRYEADGTYSVSFYYQLNLLGFARATTSHTASKLAATNAILNRLRRMPGY